MPHGRLRGLRSGRGRAKNGFCFTYPHIYRKQHDDISKPVQGLNQYGNSIIRSTDISSLRSPLRKIDLGNFHTLIIGNNRYEHFAQLDTAVHDAKAVSAVLESKYGYRVTKLKNANRYMIFRELSRLRRQLVSDDNLLIYYAGHGYLDKKTKRGYWLPVDAEAENYAKTRGIPMRMQADMVVITLRGIAQGASNVTPDCTAYFPFSCRCASRHVS